MLAAAALPAAKRSLPRLRKLAGLLHPAKPVLVNLASYPLTLAGLGAVDTGVFEASHVAGWIVTGASLMVAEHVLADET